MSQANQITKITKNKDYTKEILPDITGIGLSDMEVSKLSSILRYETGTAPLFTYINLIYQVISANFNKPERVIIIPFENKGTQHINIQRI